MDIIIVVLVLIIVITIFFLIRRDASLIKLLKQMLKQYFQFFRQQLYEKRNRNRADRKSPFAQTENEKNESKEASKIIAQNQTVDRNKMIAYPIIMRDQVASFIVANPSWKQVNAIEELLELIEDNQLPIHDKIAEISKHVQKSKEICHHLKTPYDKTSEKLFMLLEKIDSRNLSNLYEVKKELITFKSHFSRLEDLLDMLLKISKLDNINSTLETKILDEFLKIMSIEKDDILKVFSQLISLANSNIFELAIEKNGDMDRTFVNIIEKIVSLDLTDKNGNLAQEIEEIVNLLDEKKTLSINWSCSH